MKVLALSSYGVLGGAELHLRDLLVRRPADVEAVGVLIEDGPLRAALAQAGVPTWAAHGYDGRPDGRQLARFTRELRALLRREHPDVAWATGLKAAAMAVPACRLADVPLVWQKVDLSLDGAIAVPLALAVDGVIGVSYAVLEALGPARRRRVLGVVGIPVRLPVDAEVRPADDPPAIGSLGRLVPIKGHAHTIHAAATLSEELADLRVVIAGDGSPDFPGERKRLRALGDRLGLGERLELTGFADDVLPILRRLTVFVSATYRDQRGFGFEGLGAATIEAGWVGLPVVAARGGGAAEAMVDGVTGTLVARADGGLIAAAAAPYLRDAALARRTGEAGRRFARERFAPQAVADRVFALLARAAA